MSSANGGGVHFLHLPPGRLALLQSLPEGLEPVLLDPWRYGSMRQVAATNSIRVDGGDHTQALDASNLSRSHDIIELLPVLHQLLLLRLGCA